MPGMFYITLLLSCAGLSSWKDIEKLNTLPKIEEVRLLGIPLVEPYTTEERRKLVVARYLSYAV